MWEYYLHLPTMWEYYLHLQTVWEYYLFLIQCTQNLALTRVKKQQNATFVGIGAFNLLLYFPSSKVLCILIDFSNIFFLNHWRWKNDKDCCPL